MTRGRARINTSKGPTSHDHQRHEELVKLAFDWMNRTHGTQQLLARCIEDFWRRRGEENYHCDHSLLSRILNPVTPHVPAAGRPKSMRILQAIMVICAPCHNPNVIGPAQDDDWTWSGDEEQAFKIHRARLRQLREHGTASAFESLNRIGEFCATARYMDDVIASNPSGETFRQRACENVLLALGALIDPGAGGKRLCDRLCDEAVDADEARRLEAQQVHRVESILAAVVPPSVNMKAYAGVSLFYCGQADRGMAMLLDAVANSYDINQRHDPHWETLLELLDRLLREDHPQGTQWSMQAVQIAQKQIQRASESGAAELLRRAWQMVHAPQVRDHWQEHAGRLVRQIEKPGEVASPVANRVARSKNGFPGQSTVASWLMAAIMSFGQGAVLTVSMFMLTGASMNLPGIVQHVWDSPAKLESKSLAIRGRESVRPEPPPDSGTNSVHVVTIV